MFEKVLVKIVHVFLAIINDSARTNSQLGSVWLISCHVFVASTEALTNSCFLYLDLGQPFVYVNSTRYKCLDLSDHCDGYYYVSELVKPSINNTANDAFKYLVETNLL